MRISDWSSDVCSSDLPEQRKSYKKRPFEKVASGRHAVQTLPNGQGFSYRCQRLDASAQWFKRNMPGNTNPISERFGIRTGPQNLLRSEEHTSETPVTNAHLVCRLLLEKKKINNKLKLK